MRVLLVIRVVNENQKKRFEVDRQACERLKHQKTATEGFQAWLQKRPKDWGRTPKE